ncbi:hypothetical protein VTO42DRAFT_7812 [Malbranchea cinnamomea]
MSTARTRRIILTGAVAAATVSGSLYGASLKMGQEAKEEAKKRQTATTQEKINALLAVREELVTKKMTIEKQIQDLERRQEEKAARMRVSGGGGGTKEG